MTAAAAADTAPDADLSVTLFGPLTVRIQGRPLPHLRSRKAQWLLALLVLRHDRPVEREWLAGTLWPDVSQSGAFANLRPVVSELRRALGGEAGRVLSPDRHTLTLDLSGAGVAVDLVAFDAAIASGTPADLERAVALYRGPLLEGVTEEWVAQDREAREQDCLRALFRLAGAAEGVRDHPAAARHWRQAVRLDPLSEVARRGLMTALAGEGDTNAALRVYREFVELLRGDLKATPDAETEALYARLRGAARRKARSARPPSAPAAEAEDEPAVTGYLPHLLTDLVGREDEREDVVAALRRSRLVTLTGPGGIGKTRLALEVAADLAADFPDGVWLVPLEDVATGAAVAPPVTAALGLREEPGQQPAPMSALTDHLRGKRLLLVLDNCEHLLAECADVVARLLRECASLRILATSREPLGVTGETVRAVPPLAVPPADLAQLPAGTATRVRVLAGYESVLLFVERAQAALKTFALTGSNALAVARVCARLDGIPLAIELAAARVRTLTVEQIAERLGENSLLLSGARARGAPPRHQTLRAALDWSYELLDGAERTLLRRLSVFSGGWTPAAAEAVCAGEGEIEDEADVRERLPSLVEKSLVQFDGAAGEEGAGRCRLLETVRQYAAEKLAEEGAEEARRVRRRHRQWLTELAEAADPNLSGPDQETWLRRLDAERANVALALETLEAGDEAARLRLAAALGWYWFLRAQYDAGRRHLETVLAECAGHPTSTIRAKASNSAGVLAYFQADYAASRALHEEALSLYRALGDDHGAARTLGNLANVAYSCGSNEEARAFYAETLALFEAQGDRIAVARTLGNMANLAQRRGDLTEEREMNERALALFRQLEDARGVASALYRLGKNARARGDSDTSRALLEESLAACEKLGDAQGAAWALHSLGNTAHSDGDHVSAERLYERAHDVFAGISDQHGTACALYCLAELARLRGDAAAAQERAKKSLEQFEAIEDRFDVSSAHLVLADLAYDRGDLAAARARCERALEICGAVDDRWGTADALMRLGAVTLREGAAERAAGIWGAAEALRERLGVVLYAEERERFGRLADDARARLGAEAFDAAWAAGRARDWRNAAVF